MIFVFHCSRLYLSTKNWQIVIFSCFTGIQHGCYSANMATGLPLTERTLANGFSNAGYETWGFGKVNVQSKDRCITFLDFLNIETPRSFDMLYSVMHLSS